MSIIVFGLNHKTAPLNIRERLAFDGPKLQDGLVALKQLPSVKEVALLSTCNRVEIYASVRDGANALEELRNFISAFHSIPVSEFAGSLYFHHGEDAIRHLLRVASSLDSMVVGEPQILGQIKDTFDLALSNRTTGFILNRLMKKAISTAKRVRTETGIAENAVSISYAAVELAKKIFSGLAGKSVMLLGAGDMAELAARHLVNNGVKDVRVANRTYERGCELARDFCGTAVHFEDLPGELIVTDILICSTNAPSYVITKELMEQAMKGRKYRPVFLIDISVPRNIDPAANDIDNVYLYNIDDLQQVVGSNLLERRKEAAKAEDIVTEEVDKFSRWLSSLEAVPVVVAMRQKADDIKRDEVEKFRKSLPGLDSEILAAAERMANSITNKLMHSPSVAMKESDEDRELMNYAAKKLYGLDENDED
jgi:glutamyl-tRNA reductase